MIVTKKKFEMTAIIEKLETRIYVVLLFVSYNLLFMFGQHFNKKRRDVVLSEFKILEGDLNKLTQF